MIFYTEGFVRRELTSFDYELHIRNVGTHENTTKENSRD